MKICPACKNQNPESTDNCAVCNYPFSGTEKEQGIHIGQFISKKGIVHDSDNSLDRSQKLLGIIALINLVFALVFFANGNLLVIDLIFNLVVVGVFFWCAFTIKSNPILKVIISLSLYVGLQVLNFIIDPNSLLQGVVFKLIVIGSLLYSLYMINSSEKFQKKYGA